MTEAVQVTIRRIAVAKVSGVEHIHRATTDDAVEEARV